MLHHTVSQHVVYSQSACQLLIHDKAHLECFVLTTAVKRNFECVVIRHKCPHNPLQSMTDK